MTHPIPDRAHLLTIDRACEALGIGRTKLYDLVMSGALASVKIGSRRLIAVTSIAHYIRAMLPIEDEARPLTREVVEALIEDGEIQSISLGDRSFVSVDSLDTYLRAHAQEAS